MNESAIQSTPMASAASRSAMSLAVSAASGITVSGRLTPLRFETLPPISTSATMRCGVTSVATRRNLPSSMRSASPALIAAKISGCGNCTRLLSPGGEGAEPQLRPMQIDQDPDRSIMVGFDRADRSDQLAQPLMIGVAHIDAKHIGAGFEQLADHFAGS